MAQDVALWGVAYTDVPEVRVPKQGGGMAAFHDVSDTTASAADVAQGKLFHAADGTLTTGTASGGGGGSNWTLLHSETIHVSTTSTSAVKIKTISIGSGVWQTDDFVLVKIIAKSGKVAGHFFGCYTYYICIGTSPKTDGIRQSIAVNSSGSYNTPITGTYGVYCYSISYDGVIDIRARYNANYTGTIDDDFDIEVYRLSLPNGEKVLP